MARQTDAIDESLAAIAYALLDVAAAIRENTESRPVGSPFRLRNDTQLVLLMAEVELPRFT
ncbi:hypothetical protein [Streptomyces sp. NPDC052015]|uniref:hypothetical protein n=1 Tax=Streptomyces sp. NPDC052015 TaxID=3154755 RepID=UPI003449567E